VREPELALADAIASDEEVELELLRRAATAEGGVR
jgi:hypothetical protein